jgi:subtilisin family serine protease
MKRASAALCARLLRFEVLEQRQFLSASPLGDAFDFALERSLLATSAVAASNPHAMTGLDDARADYGFTGAGQTVAIIDTGLAYDHLAFGGYGAGHRVVGGYDFAERDANPYDDGYFGGHGTHVAGILSGSSPSMTGVAPGADIVALRVFDDSGQGQFAWVEEALQWVYDHRNSFEHPITTVNLSLGGQWNASSLPNWAILEDELAQLEAAGIFVAVAAGNSFAVYAQPGLGYPAVSSHVVPVGSLDGDGQLSSFSQRDARILAAPGRMILSSVPDYLGDWNGVGDDFRYMSGTSMAAPYVAGASMLLREAYALIGMTDVSQATLYNTMMTTADVVRDGATGLSYHHLNIARALDNILPADDDTTAATARPLGTVVDTLAVGGLLERRGDADWFSFTAADSGLMTIAADELAALGAQWQIGQLQAEVTDAGDTLLSFRVKAGETYRFGLAGGDTLGRYALQMQLRRDTPVAATDWGAIDQRLESGVIVSPAGRAFTFSAVNEGLLTIEAQVGLGGAVTIELRGATGQVLASATTVDGRARFDVDAAAGQSFSLCARSAAQASVSLRLTNLVRFVDGRATVTGTAGDDVFRFDVAASQLSVNGTVYGVPQGSQIAFDGGDGRDTAQVIGTAAAESAVLRPGRVDFTSPRYRATLVNAEVVDLDLGGGADRASFYDSAGDDVFQAGGGSARMTGANFDHRVSRSAIIYAYASGGFDRAALADSPGNDSFVATPTYATMTGGGFSSRAVGFDRMSAASTTGQDNAVLYDSAGNDTLWAGPGKARLFGSGFDNMAEGFRTVTVHATAGGRDLAWFDVERDARLSHAANSSDLRGATYQIRAKYFAQWTADEWLAARWAELDDMSFLASLWHQ